MHNIVSERRMSSRQSWQAAVLVTWVTGEIAQKITHYHLGVQANSGKLNPLAA